VRAAIVAMEVATEKVVDKMADLRIVIDTSARFSSTLRLAEEKVL